MSVAATAVAETAVAEKAVAETAVAEKPVVETAVIEATVPSLKSSEPQERRGAHIVAESDNAASNVESMMKDLATSDAQRPKVSYTTFAPDNLLPGSGLRPRNRRPGAALKDFRGIAQELFRT